MRVVPRSVACIQRSPRQFARLLRTVSFHLGRSGATVTAAASSSRAKPEQHSSVSIAQSQTGSEEWRKNLTGIDEEWLHGPRPALWWTGRKPTSVVHTLPQPNLERISRAATQAYFDNAWTTTEVLFSSLQGEEAFFRPPQHNLRHPMIFYYGHPACLYVNKLRLAGLIQDPIDPEIEAVMEVGVDEMSWDDMSKASMLWPSVSRVREYRRKVYDAVCAIIAELPEGGRVTQKDPLWALYLGFEHEHIHIETSSVLIRELPLRLLRHPGNFWPSMHPSATRPSPAAPTPGVDFPVNNLVPVNAQSVHIGKPLDFPSFAWDNTYGSRDVALAPFEASPFKVTNGEFYEFVKDGGYRTEEYWSKEGWGWRVFRNAKWPFFWSQDGPAGLHRYKLRCIFEEIAMPWSWPVCVNYHEAKAFLNWKTKKMTKEGKHTAVLPHELRLMTEAEHHAIRGPAKAEDHALQFGGDVIHKAQGKGGAGININLAFSSENAVDALPPSPAGFFDVFGNTWEWVEDHFNPLPDTQVHPYYDDFSTPCYDGAHQMIMGGSFISQGECASRYARYHFRPHFLQHSSFRVVKPSSPVVPATFIQTAAAAATKENVYETKALVDQYMGLHFGRTEDQIPVAHAGSPVHALKFPQRCARLLFDVASGSKGKARLAPTRRALDLGCAVGGSSFELTKWYHDVIGIDFSTAFIQRARVMLNAFLEQSPEPVFYDLPTEGKLMTTLKAELQLAPRIKPQFQVGDACNLPMATLGTFDGVLMANLLCRLPKPMAALQQLPQLVSRDGLVAFVSPFSWLEQYTPTDQWLGGFLSADGTPQDSAKQLEAAMNSLGFDMVHTEEMPLLIAEHARKYQYIVSRAMVFQRRA